MTEEDKNFYGSFMAIVLFVGLFNICFGNGNGAIACAIVFAALIYSKS